MKELEVDIAVIGAGTADSLPTGPGSPRGNAP